MSLLSKTSNPAFSNYFWEDQGIPPKLMTVSGILLKSLVSIIIIATIIVGTWHLYLNGFDVKWFITGGIIASILISAIISIKKHWAHILVPIYTIVKGLFLGGITSLAHSKFPEIPYQAVAVTVITFFVMLLLYQTRIILVTQQFKSVVITAATSIFITYLISWIFGFFGIKSFLWGTSWVAIIFNIVAAIFASLSLLLDFDFIERNKNQAPKYMEWFATWGLLVTIIWLYVEILRLLRKLAIRF